MTIAGYATGAERGYLYIRGEYPLAEARLDNAIAAAREARAARAGRHRLRVRVRHRAPARRRRLHLRRGDGAVQLDRGQARRAAQQAAVPGRGRPVRQADGDQQRRDARQRPARSCATAARPSPRSAPRDPPDPSCSACPATSPGRASTRSPFGTTLRELLELGGRRARTASAIRAILLGGAAGVFVGPDDARHPAHVRGDAGHRGDPRLGRGHGLRRDGRPRRHPAPDRRVLPRRVVRPVRAVPRRDRPPGGAAGPARPPAGRRVARATSSRLLREIGQAMRDASICGLGQTASRPSRAPSGSRELVAAVSDRSDPGSSPPRRGRSRPRAAGAARARGPHGRADRSTAQAVTRAGRARPSSRPAARRASTRRRCATSRT